MEFNNSEPIYLQVIRKMKKDMVSGRIGPGEKLPSARELSLTYQINPNTAARIYREMELMGLCTTRRGIGTFVTEDASVFQSLRAGMAGETVKGFIVEMHSLGYEREQAVQLILDEWKENKDDTGM